MCQFTRIATTSSVEAFLECNSCVREHRAYLPLWCANIYVRICVYIYMEIYMYVCMYICMESVLCIFFLVFHLVFLKRFLYTTQLYVQLRQQAMARTD